LLHQLREVAQGGISEARFDLQSSIDGRAHQSFHRVEEPFPQQAAQPRTLDQIELADTAACLA
jgi:hypothetical protein